MEFDFTPVEDAPELKRDSGLAGRAAQVGPRLRRQGAGGGRDECWDAVPAHAREQPDPPGVSCPYAGLPLLPRDHRFRGRAKFMSRRAVRSTKLSLLSLVFSRWELNGWQGRSPLPTADQKANFLARLETRV